MQTTCSASIVEVKSSTRVQMSIAGNDTENATRIVLVENVRRRTRKKAEARVDPCGTVERAPANILLPLGTFGARREERVECEYECKVGMSGIMQ